MIGDIILVSEKDYKRAKNILNDIPDQNVILIGGISGVCKSELAHALQHELWNKNKSSFIVSLDDYYITMPSIREYNRKKQGLDSVGLEEIEWMSVRRIYEDYKNNREIHFKRVHRFYDAIEHNVVDGQFDYLIFEGLYVNYLKKFYNDNYSIYLAGTANQTLAFRQRRKKENSEDGFRQQVVMKEQRVVCQLQKYCDKIIAFEE